MVEIENELSIHPCKTSQTSKTLELNRRLSSEESKLKGSFVELLSIFLKGTCPHDCFRPLPPMLGNGHSVDLLKLYCVVEQKGGFEVVSKNGLWGLVGLLYGVGSAFGSAIKLIYLKYLMSLESWLVKLPIGYNSMRVWPSNVAHSEGDSIEMQVGFSSFIYDLMDEIKKSSEHYVLKMEKSDMNFVDLTEEDVDDKKFSWNEIKMGFADIVDLTEDDFDDGKLKRKSIDMGFANDADLTEGNHDVKKLKTMMTYTSVASIGDVSEVKHVEKKLEKIKSEVSFADFVSRDVSDARRFSVGPEEADNVIMGLENSDASKQCHTQVEQKSMTVDASVFKEEVCSCERVRYSLSNHDNGKLEIAKSEMSFADAVSPEMSDAGRPSLGPDVADDVIISSENSDNSKKGTTSTKEKLKNAEKSVAKEEVSSHESKQKVLSRMLSWMAKVSKDPTDPAIGTIPESIEWAFFGDDNCWKQVLLAREALFLKKNQVNGSQHLVWEKKQKMHPSMFDDQIRVAERSSPRLLATKTPYSNQGHSTQRLVACRDMQPTASIYAIRPQQRIPVGRAFQAEVPEWTGVTTESDSKWLGTRVWPLEKRQHDSLIEREPIGKGRADNCGCQFPGSTECVRFHISERRMKMKLELGPAFYTWNFTKMGEECSLSWTAEEEKKFKYVVKENPFSLNKCFWHQMCMVFPKKSWPDLVNYYFNVFMLRRRATQNRLSFCNTDSDDDETEYRTPSSRLAFRS